MATLLWALFTSKLRPETVEDEFRNGKLRIKSLAEGKDPFSGKGQFWFKPQTEESTTKRGGRVVDAATTSLPTDTPTGYCAWASSNVPGNSNTHPCFSSSVTSSVVMAGSSWADLHPSKWTKRGGGSSSVATVLSKQCEGGMLRKKPAGTPSMRWWNNSVSGSSMILESASWRMWRQSGWFGGTSQFACRLWGPNSCSIEVRICATKSSSNGGSGRCCAKCCVTSVCKFWWRIVCIQCCLNSLKMSDFKVEGWLQSGQEWNPAPSTCAMGVSQIPFVGNPRNKSLNEKSVPEPFTKGITFFANWSASWSGYSAVRLLKKSTWFIPNPCQWWMMSWRMLACAS